VRPWSRLRDETLGKMRLNNSSAKGDLLRRLRRLEGQARGVAKMVEDDRDCNEILQQLSAVRSAAHQAVVTLVRAYAAECMVSGSSPEEIADALAVSVSRLG
jgi:DNA-binding FrmR family transcriptional regulator